MSEEDSRPPEAVPLAGRAAQAKQDEGDATNWVPRLEGVDHNVLVVGGGQNGSAFAFALSRAQVGQVSVIDAAGEDDEIGVWLTRARMNRLRTPKGLVGPELGFPGLSFQAWYESRHGAQAYAVFDRIARQDWAEYLRWFRESLGIRIRLRTQLKLIEPLEDRFRVQLEVDGKPKVEYARKIILANGVGGSGGPYLPPVLAALPSSHCRHTGDVIDFSAWAGKDVAIVGSAASAFDAAAEALETGARSVHMFVRRPRIAATTAFRSYQYPGALDHYAYLPDRVRWQLGLRAHAIGTSPPAESIDRVVRHPNFHLHLASGWKQAQLHEGQVQALTTTGERFAFDLVVAGTGYEVNLRRRPELSAIVDEIALWSDRYQPEADEAHADLAAHPYLGRSLELQEKHPGKAPWLKHIHLYNPGAQLSFGLPTGDVLTMQRSVPRVVTQISRDLFLADLAYHEQRLHAPVPPDFGIERYAAAVWQGGATATEGVATNDGLPVFPRSTLPTTVSQPAVPVTALKLAAPGGKARQAQLREKQSEP